MWRERTRQSRGEKKSQQWLYEGQGTGNSQGTGVEGNWAEDNTKERGKKCDWWRQHRWSLVKTAEFSECLRLFAFLFLQPSLPAGVCRHTTLLHWPLYRPFLHSFILISAFLSTRNPKHLVNGTDLTHRHPCFVLHRALTQLPVWKITRLARIVNTLKWLAAGVLKNRYHTTCCVAWSIGQWEHLCLGDTGLW